jgi:hypothetical protein
MGPLFLLTHRHAITMDTLFTRLKTLWQDFWRGFNWPLLRKLIRAAAVWIVIIVFIPASTPPPGDLYTGAGSHARDSLFNYVGWELEALVNKAFEAAFGVGDYLPEAERSDLVRVYMADMTALFSLEGAIAAIYTDPDINDPEAASADLRTERDTLRADLRSRQNMVENIIEGQVSAVLVDEGLATLGQVLPPVAIRFTPLPDVLIISPRDEIRVAASLSLDALTADRRSALEAAVDADLDVASLVVDIGGMALYPSMVGETDWLTWGIETSVHEWVHHYLFFFPLGLNYFDGSNPETRIINETTADLLGKELGREVLRRYYPELAPPEPDPAAEADEDAADPLPPPEPDPDAFDFSAAMHETRVMVDDLLAAGEVEASENYMEDRRAFFYENGYALRKINQAFFAFYGGYQAEDSGFGTAGDDPIGPAIAELRATTDSAADFLHIMRSITTADQLFAALEEIAVAAAP